MRSRKHSRISSTQVHQWALQRLQDGRLLKDHGPLCTAAMVWNVVLRAAARMISICAACRDLAHAPCAQAVFDALTDGVPRTLGVLEKRLNSTLIDAWPSRLKRRRWPVAIDWHLVPYYGQPQRSRNELYYGKPRQGTTKFHAYATACIVQHGHRYTLALSWVRRHESTVQVLQRLLARLAELGVQIRYMLLDRAFTAKTANGSSRNCCLGRGGCMVLLPPSASATGNGSASNRPFANCGKHAFTPARGTRTCGCYSWPSP